MSGLILGVAALVLSAAALAYSIHSNTRASMLTVVTTMLAHWNSPEMAATKRRIAEMPDHAGELAKLPVSLRDDVATLAGYLDGVGLLLREGLVPAAAVCGFIGGPAQYFWGRLAAIVELERVRRPEPGYRRDFEWLANHSG
jgi:hypothetical protein